MVVKSEGEALWDRVVAANAAWMHGEPEKVADLFAEDVAMIAPHMQRIDGRAAMVKSFVDYVKQVRTLHFRPLEYSVDVRGDIAVLTYTFDVRYQVEEMTYEDRGQEVLVFARRDGRFEAVWRTQVTLHSRELTAFVEP